MRRSKAWMGSLAGMAVAWLISIALFRGFGPELEASGLGLLPNLLLGVAVVVFLIVLRRQRLARTPPARGVVRAPSGPPALPLEATMSDQPGSGSSFDEGVRDIRRMDPKFDPARFVGYIEMVFRATHAARMTRDIPSLRDRVTPELYGELQAQGERSETLRHASHFEQMDIRAEVTEAWHEKGRDYVTAYIEGSMLAYTVDEATGTLVNGSKTALEKVEAFWTFTRPGGLNFWMLGAIQSA